MLNNYRLVQARVTSILLEAALKEYAADWLKNADSVVRDETGKFAKKAADTKMSVEQEIKDKAGDLKDLADKASAVAAEFEANIPKYVSQIAAGIQSTPKLFESAKDFTFGGGYKESIENLIIHFKSIEAELRKAATKKYKEFEPKLQEMKGKEFEQAIQDELIKLHLLEKRSLMEDIKDIDSPDDIEKVFKEHKADLLATAVSVATSVLFAIDQQTPLNIVFAAILAIFGGSFAIAFLRINAAAFAFEIPKEAAKGIADLLVDGTEAEKNKEKIHNVINLVAVAACLAITARDAVRLHKSFKNAWDAKRAADPEAYEAMESLLSKLGVDSVPQTKEELKAAHRKIARKLHPDAGGSEEEFMKMQKAYEELQKRLGF